MLALTGGHHHKKRHHRVHWHHAGASIFGNPCESGSTGYRGVDLNSHPWSFAELGNGYALGGLSAGTAVLLRDPSTGRTARVHKNDIGLGGGSVGGFERKFDLYAPLAKWLAGAGCNWTGVIEYAIL